MIITILIAFFTIISLMVIHEFGHFIFAKKFGARVEEFGIGYPPRICGKKIGETFYSINLIPFGAFVKIFGEEGGLEDYHSFSGKPMWQRMLIILGGVLSFWIVAIILLSIVFGLGMPTPVEDDVEMGIVNPKVQISQITKDSPAAMAGLEAMDIILKVSSGSEEIDITKVNEVIGFVDEHKGTEVILTIKRWGEIKEVNLIPRISPPNGEGAIGIGLVRTALIPSKWYEAPFYGVIATWNITKNVLSNFAGLFGQMIEDKKVPDGVSFMGPLGIFDFLRNAVDLGVNYFLYFVALISIFLAIFNLFPIPALDGGKMIFLAIEVIRGKPVPEKVEQNITAFCFFTLIALMLFVTIRFDIPRLF